MWPFSRKTPAWKRRRGAEESLWLECIAAGQKIVTELRGYEGVEGCSPCDCQGYSGGKYLRYKDVVLAPRVRRASTAELAEFVGDVNSGLIRRVQVTVARLEEDNLKKVGEIENLRDTLRRPMDADVLVRASSGEGHLLRVAQRKRSLKR